MRILIIVIAAALLAACGNSGAAGTSGSSSSSGSTSSGSGSSGGSTGGPASGTATLTGTASFTANTVFFRWQQTADGGASRQSAQVIFSDVTASCAELTDGLNRHFTTFTVLGIEPRFDGGLVAGHYSYSEATGDPADGMDLGWFGAIQGETPPPDSYDAVSADLSSVADDAISGSFTITWSAPDGGSAPAPLQGTFSAPLCGPRP